MASGQHYKQGLHKGQWFKWNSDEWLNARGAYLNDDDTYQAIRDRDEAERLAHNKKIKKNAAVKQVKKDRERAMA